MNDYEASFMATDHRKQLLAEADRHRLSSESRRPAAKRTPAKPRSGLRISLDFLLGRTPA